MTWDQLYDDAARARLVDEPVKRVDAPERTPFERDRARVVHSASLRRLAAKTQVLGPGTDDFVRNRLTHSLEVAQIGREFGAALGCSADVVDTALSLDPSRWAPGRRTRPRRHRPDGAGRGPRRRAARRT